MHEVLTSFAFDALNALIPVVAALLAALLVMQLRKKHLEVTAEQQARFENIIRRTLQWVEEYFAAKAAAGVPVNAAMKLSTAITKAQEFGASKYTVDQIANEIMAKLPETPFGAAAKRAVGK